MKTYDFYIGIDCGVNTGLAIWSKKLKRLILTDTIPIHTAMNIVDNYNSIFKIFVRVEDARKRKWIPQERDIQQRIGRAKGAGSVCRDAKIWEGFLTDLGVDFEMVAPCKGMTKHSATSFKQLTKYEGKTSEHARDAAMLVFGY